MKRLHNWNLSYSQAIELQKRLASEVQFAPIKEPPRLIAGLDCAMSKDGRRIIAAVVVLQTPAAEQNLWGSLEPADTNVIPAQAGIHFEVVETADAIEKVNFPYIPGLLSFRESPACLAAVEKLKHEPDVFLIDGQGIAHPRRLGIASHLGLFFDKPTIGCAKSRLTGYFQAPPLKQGSYSLLLDRRLQTTDYRPARDEGRETRDEIIGAVVRTRTNVEPVFVSVGNKCLLNDAIKITLDCTTKYRIPEPTRLAHQLVSKLKLKA